MIAIDNSGLVNYCRSCNCSGFIPVLTYAYNAAAKTVTVTNASTVSSPDGWKIGRITVHDQFGNTAYNHIDTVSGNAVVNTATLDASKPYSITATLVTNGGCTADGSASKIGAAGALGGWDKKFSEASAQTPLSPEPEPNPIGVNKVALQAKLNAVALLDEDTYTVPTWAAFITSKTAALAVLNDEDATQDEVNNALADLTAKHTALVAV